MVTKNKLLTILSDAEQFALYGLPDFDDGQRLDYLYLSEQELALSCSRPSLHAQAYCALQIGYFKAKHTFFRFTWEDAQDDCTFVLTRYFSGQAFASQTITKHEHYAQRTMIAELFGFRLRTADCLPQLAQQVEHIVRRDVTPGFIAAERSRLGALLATVLDTTTKEALAQLLVRDDTLSELAALKQDAKHFGWRQMAHERETRTMLEPLHRIAKALLPQLAISQQNLHYYASLANFNTVYDLRRLKPDQTRLYLLCYAWRRYRQRTDNLVDALGYHMKKLEDESKIRSNQHFVTEQVRRQRETPQVGRLLLLYVDDTVTDVTPFGDVRRRAFKIMSPEALQTAAQR